MENDNGKAEDGMIRTRTRVVLVVIAALLVTGGWFVTTKALDAAQEGESPQRRGEASVPVDVANVVRGNIQEVRRFSGTMAPQAEFMVAPKVSGRIQRLLVDIGDVVERGQLVALLDEDERRLQVEEVQAELSVAEANLEDARSAFELRQREYDRIRSLRAEEAVPESELDRAQLEFDAARSRLRVAEAQLVQRQAALQAARVRLGYTQVVADWETGGDVRVVGERFRDEGATISANQEILSVLDISELKAVVHVTERDYSRLSTGQEAVVRVDGFPGEEFRGEIVRMAPLFRETSRQARVEIGVPNEDGLLKPGMFVRAGIVMQEKEDAQVIPRDSLVTRNGSQGVFVADREGQVANFVEVVTGVEQGGYIEVVSPELDGPVVTLGQHLLADGSALRIQNSAEGFAAGNGDGSAEVMQ